MNPKAKKKFLALTRRRTRWRKCWSWIYKDSAHEYLMRRWQPAEFKALAKAVRKHGLKRLWRTRSYRFLIVGRFAYWQTGDAFNRTYREALSFNGHPSAKVQDKIRRRFWMGRSRSNIGRSGDRDRRPA